MMKKTLIMVPFLAGVIFLGGCGNTGDTPKASEGGSPAVENNMETKKESVSDKVAGGLKEMLSVGKTMECSTADDGVTTKIYIKGQKYKSVTDSKEMKMTGIFDGEAFYSWNTMTKAGTKMTMACMKEMEKNMPESPAVPGEESISSTDKLIEEEAKKNNCKEASENVDFSIPADISFVDQCAMMKDMTKNMKDFKMPEGAKIPSE